LATYCDNCRKASRFALARVRCRVASTAASNAGPPSAHTAADKRSRHATPAAVPWPKQTSAAAPMTRDRVKKLSEVSDMEYFWKELPYEPADLLPKKKDKPIHDAAATADALKRALAVLESLSDWSVKGMEEAVRPVAEQLGWKPQELFMTLRVAVTGRTVSTPLFETVHVLGREESLRRLRHAVARLG